MSTLSTSLESKFDVLLNGAKSFPFKIYVSFKLRVKVDLSGQFCAQTRKKGVQDHIVAPRNKSEVQGTFL
jgi:hypothetical protein